MTFMSMVKDRTGAFVEVPKVSKVEAVRNGQEGLLVLTLGKNFGISDMGVISFATYEDALQAAESVKSDMDAGRDSPYAVAVVQTGPSGVPWRFLTYVGALLVIIACMNTLGWF